VLHDVGITVMATALPDMFEAAMRLAMADSIPFHCAEERLLSFTHAEIGAYLLAIWGLPESTVEAVAFHHHPAPRVRERRPARRAPPHSPTT